MSESEPREWRFYIDDMIRSSEKVMAYTEGLDQQAFVDSALNYDATLRNLELIGEAATRIPEQVRKEHAGVPWRMIIATRNRRDSRLSGHRQRHFVEHHPDRYSGTDSAAGTDPVSLTGGMPGIFQQDTD